MPFCSTAFRREFEAPMFDLAELNPSPSRKEGEEGEDGEPLLRDGNNNTRRLDIGKTLSPRPRLPYIGTKLFIMLWSISILYMSINKWRHPSFWMAYLTHWGFVVTTAYTIMSAFSAVYLAMRPPANPGVLEKGVGLLVKTTWALLAISVPSECIITIMYWAVVFDYSDDKIEYVRVMVHGCFLVIIIIDGFLLSRLPLRMKQFILMELFACSYLIWTLIHAYSGIGNPYKDAGEQNDDAIYTSLAWKKNTGGTVVMSVVILFVANPIVFLLCRALSRLPPMRLCEKGEGQQNEPVAHLI